MTDDRVWVCTQWWWGGKTFPFITGAQDTCVEEILKGQSKDLFSSEWTTSIALFFIAKLSSRIYIFVEM